MCVLSVIVSDVILVFSQIILVSDAGPLCNAIFTGKCTCLFAVTVCCQFDVKLTANRQLHLRKNLNKIDFKSVIFVELLLRTFHFMTCQMWETNTEGNSSSTLRKSVLSVHVCLCCPANSYNNDRREDSPNRSGTRLVLSWLWMYNPWPVDWDFLSSSWSPYEWDTIGSSLRVQSPRSNINLPQEGSVAICPSACRPPGKQPWKPHSHQATAHSLQTDQQESAEWVWAQQLLICLCPSASKHKHQTNTFHWQVVVCVSLMPVKIMSASDHKLNVGYAFIGLVILKKSSNIRDSS